MSVLFAATYPERVHGLVLYGSGALWTDAKKRFSSDGLKQRIAEMDRLWGTGEIFMHRFTPSKLGDETIRRFVARWAKAQARPL